MEGRRELILSLERRQKVEKIFQLFDRNGDGGLNRYEMAALVTAVNPRCKLTEDQISGTLNDIFGTYGQYVDGDRGLTLEGLLRIYGDGAGDIDRDFDELNLELDNPGQRLRKLKVAKIFKQFDRNGDGGLNRYEMAALVIAVNPQVKFSEDQMSLILDEVFRTYGEFVDGDKGLALSGLVRSYDDGAGDVDRDFDGLGLVLEVDEGGQDRICPGTGGKHQSVVPLRLREQPRKGNVATMTIS